MCECVPVNVCQFISVINYEADTCLKNKKSGNEIFENACDVTWRNRDRQVNEFVKRVACRWTCWVTSKNIEMVWLCGTNTEWETDEE